MITKMIGGLSAAIKDAGGHVEVWLVAPDGDQVSFDLEGWLGLVEEMQAITQLAEQVHRSNSPLWEKDA